MRVLSRMWQMLLKGITEVQGATRPAAAAEMVLVRIAYVADLPTPDEAIRMLDRNDGESPAVTNSATPHRPSPASASSVQPSAARAMSAPRAAAEPVSRPQATAPMVDPAGAVPAVRLENFTELVALAGAKRDLIIKAALEADMRLVRMEDGRLEVALERSAARTLVNELARKLEQWTGRRWTVIVSNEPGQPTLRSQALLQKNERERAAEADPRVKDVLARFPGAKVVEVRKLALSSPDSDAVPDDLADGFDDD
jgi:DNA polymerase-3 subunit gamma/tau